MDFDTNFVLEWLVETAKQEHFSVPDDEDMNSSAPSTPEVSRAGLKRLRPFELTVATPASNEEEELYLTSLAVRLAKLSSIGYMLNKVYMLEDREFTPLTQLMRELWPISESPPELQLPRVAFCRMLYVS